MANRHRKLVKKVVKNLTLGFEDSQKKTTRNNRLFPKLFGDFNAGSLKQFNLLTQYFRTLPLSASLIANQNYAKNLYKLADR